jgi:hypothetical protein
VPLDRRTRRAEPERGYGWLAAVIPADVPAEVSASLTSGAIRAKRESSPLRRQRGHALRTAVVAVYLFNGRHLRGSTGERATTDTKAGEDSRDPGAACREANMVWQSEPSTSSFRSSSFGAGSPCSSAARSLGARFRYSCITTQVRRRSSASCATSRRGTRSSRSIV